MEIDIKNFIEENINSLKDRLYPVFTTDLQHLTVAYKFTDVSVSHVSQSQMELKIIWSDYDECEEMKARLKELLGMEEDEPFIVYGSTRFHSTVSAGGGCLFNEGCQMYEDTLYIIIDWRYINNVKCR